MNDFYKSSKTETNDYSPSLQDYASKSSKKNKQSQIKVDFDILSNIDKFKFVDSSINKYYLKYIQKQVFIQQEQKIYEILEKTDEPKIFNTLRRNYLKEKEELKNMGGQQNTNRKVTDIISYVNLNNCKKKLYSIYKLSADDLGFMTSFMEHLAHRQKKIYKPKVNKKLDALSKGKLGNFLKKNNKNEKNEKNNEHKKVILNNNNNLDTENHNKNYLKVLLKKLSNDSIKDNNKSFEESKPKKNLDNIHSSENNSDYPQNDTIKKYFKKKNTEILHSNNMKLFKNSGINNLNLTHNNSKIFVDNDKKPSMNNINTFLRNKSKSKNYALEENKDIKIEKNENTSNIKLTSKFNYNLTKPSNVNANTNFRDTIINKVTIDIKDTDNNKEEVKINIEDSLSNTNDNNNKRKSRDSLINSRFINNNEEKSKILKLYKTSRNEFLQKVKQEGNILNKTSNRLFSLLYKLKNENFETFQNERNKKKNLSEKNAKTLYTQENINNNKIITKFSKTYFPKFKKSRFRIPYINKVVYGENNQHDTFEELQKELFHEVKYQMKKVELAKKKNKKKGASIVGREILNKLMRTDSGDRMRKELKQINNNQGKLTSNRKDKNKSKMNSIKKSSGKKNE